MKIEQETLSVKAATVQQKCGFGKIKKGKY